MFTTSKHYKSSPSYTDDLRKLESYNLWQGFVARVKILQEFDQIVVWR